MTTVIGEPLRKVLLRQIEEQEQLEDARKHPGLLLQHVRCIDNTNGDRFQFSFSDEQLQRWREFPYTQGQEYDCGLTVEELRRRLHNRGRDDWFWHGDLIDWWLVHDIAVELKARQLGVTWCDAGVNLWYGLYVPGSRTIIQSKNEDDASDYVDHVWEMWLSLGPRINLDTDEREDLSHLRNGARCTKPGRPGIRPYLDVEWEHEVRDGNGVLLDTKQSMMNAMASTAGSGHGRTAARASLDEFARHPYAREAFKAIVPTQAGSKKVSGKTNGISTGNGVSNEQDGSGNFFHHLWITAEEKGIAKLFLRWDMNPDRDAQWYATGPPSKLDAKDRGEQYPNDEFEAFILTGDVYFDVEILEWYKRYRVRAPLRRFTFEEIPNVDRDGQPVHGKPIRARAVESSDGWIKVYAEPKAGGRYAISADTASGKGLDASAAGVIDLDTMERAATLHSARIGAAEYAKQLHYLGRMYGNARIAVESAGGWGEPVIIFLKDGKDGRPPYPHVYQHVIADDPEKPRISTWGFPMNTKTRPLVIEGLGRALSEKTLPWLDNETLGELLTFVHAPTNPSPRAQEGTRDDRVMELAIGVELYRQRGYQPRKIKRQMRKPPRKLTPW